MPWTCAHSSCSTFRRLWCYTATEARVGREVPTSRYLRQASRITSVGNLSIFEKKTKQKKRPRGEWSRQHMPQKSTIDCARLLIQRRDRSTCPIFRWSKLVLHERTSYLPVITLALLPPNERHQWSSGHIGSPNVTRLTGATVSKALRGTAISACSEIPSLIHSKNHASRVQLSDIPRPRIVAGL